MQETLAAVEALLKKHEAFERSMATQEERFAALERLTTVTNKRLLQSSFCLMTNTFVASLPLCLRILIQSHLFLFIDVLANFDNTFCDKDIVIPVVFLYHVYTEIQRTGAHCVQQDISMRGNC